MKKFVKKTTASMMALGMLASCGMGLTGCGAVDNSEKTLEIFVVPAGYGTQWLTDLIEKFKEQDWVKQSYPELNIPEPKGNTISDYIPSQITAGGDINTVDLFFSCQAIAGKYEAGDAYFEDLYEDVYNSTVPGEEVKVSQKMNQQIYQEEAFVNADGETKYYAMPWVNGMMGIMYNATRVKTYLGADYVMPRTTDELIQCTADLKAADNFPEDDAPWLFGDGNRYFNAPFVVWWSQYEGKQQYLNYWNGVDEDGNFSNVNFSQTGRLRALQVYEDLIDRPLGNNHKYSTTKGTFDNQKFFLSGRAGIFMPIGDWLMTETATSVDKLDEIKMMKMPVISSIVETLTFWAEAETDGEGEPIVYDSLTATQKKAYDEKLACIVQCVDEQKTYSQAATVFNESGYGELQQADFAKVQEARNMMYRMTGHEAFVPSYATGKAIAKDFLRFMATDIGIQTYMDATKGTLTPYNYTVDAEKMSTYYPLQQDHYAYMQTVVSLPPESVFKLNYFGGVNQMTKWPSLEQAFSAQNANERKTAAEIFAQDVSEWTKSKFDMALIKAKLN